MIMMMIMDDQRQQQQQNRANRQRHFLLPSPVRVSPESGQNHSSKRVCDISSSLLLGVVLIRDQPSRRGDRRASSELGSSEYFIAKQLERTEQCEMNVDVCNNSSCYNNNIDNNATSEANSVQRHYYNRHWRDCSPKCSDFIANRPRLAPGKPRLVRDRTALLKVDNNHDDDDDDSTKIKKPEGYNKMSCNSIQEQSRVKTDMKLERGKDGGLTRDPDVPRRQTEAREICRSETASDKGGSQIATTSNNLFSTIGRISKTSTTTPLCHLSICLITALIVSLTCCCHCLDMDSLEHERAFNQLAAEFAPTRAPNSRKSHLLNELKPPVLLHRTMQPLQSAAQAHSGEFEKLPMPSSASATVANSKKFTRTNELDVFLDEMNNNELRAVAAGQPIGNMFQPKPLMSSTNQLELNKQANERPADLQSEPERSSGQGSGRADDNNDEEQNGSQSRQQIYSECALILQRTYVKSIDHPKHQLIPFGKTEQACISYKHIDKAIEQAKHQLKLRELTKRRKAQQVAPNGRSLPKAPPFEVIHSTLEPPEDLIAAIGEINMAATQIIADQFDLSNDELLNGLPLIDMSKTKFWSICPLLVRQDIKCEIGRFRTFTGHCNNLKHPTWGAAMTPFARYLPPVHPDGIWTPRKSIVTEITFELSPGHHETDTNVPVPVLHTLASEPIGDQLRVGGLSSPRPSTNVGGRAVRDPLEGSNSVQFVRHAHMEFAQTGVVSESGQPGGGVTHYHETHGPDRQTYLATSLPNYQPQATSPAASAVHKPARGQMPQELPSARLVTSVAHRDYDMPSHDFSILFMSWGQLLDHDMTRAAQPPSSIKCCEPAAGNQPRHKLCLPIQVPANDPFYSKFNVRCLEFRRSLAGVRPNCVLGPRVHQNAITSPIDANFVYGSSRALADALRLFKGGRLRDRDWFARHGLKPLLPAQDQDPDLECIARPKDLFCFLAGDVRVNEQTHLTVLHTLYMREHNRIADRLSELNPHWDDERTYQETRHIMAASVQHVMINEYIPLLIGKKMSELYNLTGQSNHPHGHLANPLLDTTLGGQNAPNVRSYWHGYDPSVTTSVSNSFAAAAFRQGHTFVQGSVERYNKLHEFVASEKLRHLFKQPFLLYQPGVLDELTAGMINQPAQNYDPFISEDISGHLFQPPELKFGHDLAAINLQRGREQGLPGYNLFREWCGLPRAETFHQLEPYLTNRTAYHYSRLYKHVDDIDLWSGGISERKLPGAAIGPTFACIIARQFSNTRRGDRFWYENPGLPSSFTPQQLGELRKISLAKILCANSDDLPTIQRWALRMPHPVLNPRLPCSQLAEPNLLYWQEE